MVIKVSAHYHLPIDRLPLKDFQIRTSRMHYENSSFEFDIFKAATHESFTGARSLTKEITNKTDH